MQLSFEPARLRGFAIFAIAGATALSAGACSSSHDDKAPGSSAPAAAGGKDTIHGLIASVSGTSVQVTEASGTATVDVSPTTKVSEFTNAQMTDVASGNCVNVGLLPASAPNAPRTARGVNLTDGKCPQPKSILPNRVIGIVASVSGNTIHISVKDSNGNPSQTDVLVNDATHYTKRTTATSQAIAQGKCITAQGTKDGGGTLQAASVNIGPTNQQGQCPQQPAPKQKPK